MPLLTAISKTLGSLNDLLEKLIRFALVLLAGGLSDFVFRHLPLSEAAQRPLIYFFIFFYLFIYLFLFHKYFFKRSKLIHSCDNTLPVIRAEMLSCVTPKASPCENQSVRC